MDSHKQNISRFFFKLTRKYSPGLLHDLSLEYDELMTSMDNDLSICDDTKEVNEYVSLFALLYKLILFTRDIYSGMGERDLCYMMIYVWHKHFPSPAFHALQMCCRDGGGGSWKDIVYFCRYIRQISPIKENDPLIHKCVVLLNEQLETDYLVWNRSRSPDNISLVCKWIPRENSSFHWLYQKCILQWASKYRMHYFTPFRIKDAKSVSLSSLINARKAGISGKMCMTAKTDLQIEKAIKKCKKEYRKCVSELTRACNVIEVKMCAKQTSNEDYAPLYAQMLYRSVDFCKKTEKRKGKWEGRAYGVSLGDLARNILRDYANPEEVLGKEMEEKKAGIASKIWNKLSLPFSLYKWIPFLDLSFYDRPEFIDAVAICAKIAEFSSFGPRLMTYDHMPRWIHFDENVSGDTYIQSILNDRHIGYGSSNIITAIDLLISSFLHVSDEKNDEKNDDTNEITLVFLVSAEDYGPSILAEEIRKRFNNAGLKCPFLLFWYVGENIVGGDSIQGDNYLCVSGCYFPLLQTLSSLPNMQITQYELLLQLIRHSNNRYQHMEDYLFDLISNPPSSSLS